MGELLIVRINNRQAISKTKDAKVINLIRHTKRDLVMRWVNVMGRKHPTLLITHEGLFSVCVALRIKFSTRGNIAGDPYIIQWYVYGYILQHCKLKCIHKYLQRNTDTHRFTVILGFL